ncbi:EAL domain-containing protein [Caldimonas sp. KR1-144]|uniref:EAL domain-containing protein n=1 Tax=Caldimonas sp. KR1-144 TaxID=3400911 RepID=UPI003C05D138
MIVSPSRILLVDDLPSIHQDFRKILAPAVHDDLAAIEASLFGEKPAAAGPVFELDSAYQGEEALGMLQSALGAGRPYELAFVDMRMPPGWDGVQTIERLWRVDPRLQVVICTAFADHAWSDVLRRLNGNDSLLILKKPFDAIEVSQLARALTAKWRLARQTEAHVDALEAAVQQRTLELSTANDGLRAEIMLRHEVERCLRVYAAVIRSTGEAVAITDVRGEIVEVNPAYEHTVGRTRDELVGRPVHGLDFDTPQAREVWRALHREGRWSGEILDRRSSGELFPALVQINTVQGDEDEPRRYVCLSRDITGVKQTEQQLQKLAFYDPLTELPNRALFGDRLRVALATAQRQSSRLAVMYIDLDHFKDVNDSLGHQAGDRLLVEVSHRIAGCVRAVDTVARMGGDEFTVLLSQLSGPDDAQQVARRIIEAMHEPVKLGEATVHVGASIGISLYPQHGNDAVALQQNADLAMYEAKSAGRGQMRLYSEDMSARSGERLQLAAAIEQALERHEFTLAYQPIVNAATGAADKAEALIRWRGADGKPISPATFIPYAEESGLICRIDRWVLERACTDAVEWRAAGHAVGVCVNLSALTVQQPELADTIAEVLHRTGLPPAGLTIEITETAVVGDPYAARRILESVMALGVGVSVDDFGTGYASLSYLTLFPINCIKLDRSFVDRIGKDAASEEVIRSMLELARKLRLNVVAEGIEEADQERFLGIAGCDHLQGFLLARPMGVEQLLEWLAGGAQPTAASCRASSPQGLHGGLPSVEAAH